MAFEAAAIDSIKPHGENVFVATSLFAEIYMSERVDCCDQATSWERLLVWKTRQILGEERLERL